MNDDTRPPNVLLALGLAVPFWTMVCVLLFVLTR